MSGFTYDLNNMLGKLQAQLIRDRLKFEVLSDLMIEKGIITEDELDKRFADTYEKKWELYTADTLGVSIEEYRELIKDDKE